MYAAVVNSPKTELTELITDTQTDIAVTDASVLLQGEGIAVIGNGDAAETINYTSIDSNTLKGCVRGFEGTARAWIAGTRVARNFTAYDHNSFKANIEELETELANAAAVADAAIPSSEKGAANGVATLGTDKKVPAAQLPISTATNNTSTTQVASASAVKAANDLAAAAFPKKYQDLPQDVDMNSMTTPGNYQGVWPSPRINEPFQNTGARRVELIVFGVGSLAFQRLTYIDGAGTGKSFWRENGSGSWRGWNEVFTTSGGTINGSFTVNSPITLPGAANSAQDISASTIYVGGGNVVKLITKAVRTAVGTNWESTAIDLQRVTDSTDQAVLRFQGDDVLFRNADGTWTSLRSLKANSFSGNGSPEGALPAPVGSLYRRWDGGTGSTLYVKESGSGNTGWRAI
ncbi:phage tail protein [Paenibacillus sp. P96]|uniref:Phage tail protein n=1 Tax=Paenibacillus zeirhizosphaerae TaxID=2987519 RepID=A0ABT9FL71_9BACL|nr:phage tail protein [Paenibacillus sp. P96]MDP4095479.1 phage tail protein [Paenibacillus sp. P96]